MKKARPHELGLEVQFEEEVRRVPAGARRKLLPFLHDWRRTLGRGSPRRCAGRARVFWVMDEAGQWRRL